MFQDQMTSNGLPPFFPAQFTFQGVHEDHNSLIHLLPTTPQSGAAAATMYTKGSISFSGVEELNVEDELSDDGAQLGERKKRLNLEQVRTLERNFEMGNKLEPERKIQLARALGLQPRQIAIWFQNKRARWKTKQLEKDYDCLKRQFEAAKAENDVLQAQNKRLHVEILNLKGMASCEPINLNKEFEACCSNRSENGSDLNLDISKAPATTESSPISQQGMMLFPAYRTPMVSQLFEGPLKIEPNCQKVENGGQDEHLCNMFGNIDEQSAFWAWSEHNNFP